MRNNLLELAIWGCVLLVSLPLPCSGQAKLDNFGNPVGEQFGLLKGQEFKGKRIVIYCPQNDRSIQAHEPEKHSLWRSLQNHGFSLDFQTKNFQPEMLNQADQLWVFCTPSNTIHDEGAKAIVDFVNKGKGLYVVADNDPYVTEATKLGQLLFGVTVHGNYHGTKLVGVRHGAFNESGSQTAGGNNDGNSSGKVAAQLPKGAAKLESNVTVNHYVDSHDLLTDLNVVYEGITISHLQGGDNLKVVLLASDGQPLVAVSTVSRQRVVFDCGFTRYYEGYVDKTAGTVRFGENIAAYLMGKGGAAILDQPVSQDTTQIGALFKAWDDVRDEATKRKLAQRLQAASPTFAQVRDSLPDMLKAFQGDDAQLKSLARDQLLNAFARAPMSETLRWCGEEDEELQALIQQQIAARLERADEDRRNGYRDIALQMLGDREEKLATHQAALKLLVQLKDKTAVSKLIDLLPLMHRSLWPDAGAALNELTGQNFGPKTGDGVAELQVSVKKWRAWWETQNK